MDCAGEENKCFKKTRWGKEFFILKKCKKAMKDIF